MDACVMPRIGKSMEIQNRVVVVGAGGGGMKAVLCPEMEATGPGPSV